jgi:hypothetical protein
MIRKNGTFRTQEKGGEDGKDDRPTEAIDTGSEKNGDKRKLFQ